MVFLLDLFLKGSSAIKTEAYWFSSAETELWEKLPYSSQTMFVRCSKANHNYCHSINRAWEQSSPFFKHAFISYFMYFTYFPSISQLMFAKFIRLSTYWLFTPFIYIYIKPIFSLSVLPSCLCYYNLMLFLFIKEKTGVLI